LPLPACPSKEYQIENHLHLEYRKESSMSAVRQEIHNLMAGILISAKASPSPQFCPKVMSTVLVEEMEQIWTLMPPESKVAMALIAVTMQQQDGAVATRPKGLAAWLRPFRTHAEKKRPPGA
jgi:hypothetical protein